MRIHTRGLILQRWKERWVGSSKGRWTTVRLKRKHEETNYYQTQRLTGHGSFRVYTYSIGNCETDECVYWGEKDTAEYTIFYCRQWREVRTDCSSRLGISFRHETRRKIEAFLSFLSRERFDQLLLSTQFLQISRKVVICKKLIIVYPV